MLHDPDTCNCRAENLALDEVSAFAHIRYKVYCSLIWRAIHDSGLGLREYLQMMAKRDAGAKREAQELEDSFPSEESKSWPVPTT